MAGQDPIYVRTWQGGIYERSARLTPAEVRDLTAAERRELDRTGSTVRDDGSEVSSW